METISIPDRFFFRPVVVINRWCYRRRRPRHYCRYRNLHERSVAIPAAATDVASVIIRYYDGCY